MTSSENKNRFKAMTCSSWKLAYTNEKSNMTNTVIKKTKCFTKKIQLVINSDKFKLSITVSIAMA